MAKHTFIGLKRQDLASIEGQDITVTVKRTSTLWRRCLAKVSSVFSAVCAATGTFNLFYIFVAIFRRKQWF